MADNEKKDNQQSQETNNQSEAQSSQDKPIEQQETPEQATDAKQHIGVETTDGNVDALIDEDEKTNQRP